MRPAAPRVGAGAIIGFGLIWAFLILFVLYPLTRIFYDAFTNEAGQFTLINFQEFFTDGFYLRSLWNSLVLGVAAVITTSVIGIAVAFLIIRYDFPACIDTNTAAALSRW
jgi:ABC-type Fe3+ transport system permease subunit